jgi:hypothetical protein
VEGVGGRANEAPARVESRAGRLRLGGNQLAGVMMVQTVSNASRCW